MNDEQRIAKLEALLARVLSRKRGELANGNANGHPPPAGDVATSFQASFAPPAAPSAPAAPPSPIPSPPPSRPAAPHFASIATPVHSFFPSQPPPRDRPSATPAKPQAPSTIAPPDASLDQSLAEIVAAPSLRSRTDLAAVRPLAPPPDLVDLDLEREAALPPAPPSIAREEILESKSRLVSAPPSSRVEPLDELEDEPFRDAPASDPTLEVGVAEFPEEEELEEERAPSSSRRPISLEEKMSELDDAPPLHTPPPASGRLPAANPIESVMETSATGTKTLEAMLEEERDLEAAAEHATTTGTGEVAAFVGELPHPMPRTFGDLLDEALKL